MTLKRDLVFALGIFTVFFSPMFVRAAIQQNDSITIGEINNNSETGVTPFDYGTDATYGTTAGGEFLVVGGGETFKTFCLEYSEHINIGGTYRATIDNDAMFGGGGASGGSDPLSTVTTALYRNYLFSTLDEKDIGVNDFRYDNKYWADALQLAIWKTEKEVNDNFLYVPGNVQLGNTVVTYSQIGGTGSTTTTTGDLANALIAWALTQNGDSHVRVLNLWTLGSTQNTTTNAKQSQLYYDSNFQEGGTVPEPASLVIWGAGLGIAGFVAARRRKMAKAA